MKNLIICSILTILFSGCASDSPYDYDGSVVEITHPDGTVERRFEKRQPSNMETAADVIGTAIFWGTQ